MACGWKNQQNIAEHPWDIQHFVDELTSYFYACRTQQIVRKRKIDTD